MLIYGRGGYSFMEAAVPVSVYDLKFKRKGVEFEVVAAAAAALQRVIPTPGGEED